MANRLIFLTPLAALALSGCLAKTAFDVVTAPVRIAGKAVDLATTSQGEADQKRGRELRRREERLGALERDRVKQQLRCDDGNADACAKRDAAAAEIAALSASVPVEPRR